MKYFDFKIICIDLRKYSTYEDILKLLEDNEIVGLYVEKILELREKYNKIYIDVIGNELFAVLHKNGEIELSVNTDTHLFNLKSLKPQGKVLMKDLSDLTLDQILDKINKSGIDSLTPRAKYFLKKHQ